MKTPLRRILILVTLLAVTATSHASDDARPLAVFTTSMGSFTAELFPDSAPKACENFTTHARNGYYDGILVHRVEEDFVIQSGDPAGTGYSGRSIWGEPFENEIDPSLTFDEPFVLAMANRGTAKTNNSQYFVTVAPAPWMTGAYTIFGRVIEGREVVEAINGVDIDPTSQRPIRDVVVESIEIRDGASE